MTTSIMHISDLHFGRSDLRLVEDLLQEIHRRSPALVIASGDFTQAGLNGEFAAARQFLRRVAAPVFAVPGNHDVPRYNLFERFRDPFKRYREAISPLPDSYLETGDFIVVGLNSARAAVPHWNWANGMLSRRQIKHAESLFEKASAKKYKIFVCHHPLLQITDAPIDCIVWNAALARTMLERNHVALALSGHIHHASITEGTRGQYTAYVGAGTAISTRLRSQANGYNWIEIMPETIRIDLMTRSDGRFEVAESKLLPRA